MSLKNNVENKNSWEDITFKDNMGRKVNVHNFKDRSKLEFILMGDEHIGNKFYDEKLHKSHIEYALDHKMPLIHMGDMIEAATRNSVGAGVYEQKEIIQQQLEKAVKTYEPLAKEGLLLGMLTGNHEARGYKDIGVDITKIMATMLKTNYLGVGAAHIFRVGNQSYTIYTTHGSSGARMPHTKIANIIKSSSMIDAEIYAQGHVHQLSHHIQNFYTINKRNKTIEESQKHYILTGSYLDHWGSYAHVGNMEPARKGSVRVKLDGKEKDIRVKL